MGSQTWMVPIVYLTWRKCFPKLGWYLLFVLPGEMSSQTWQLSSVLSDGKVGTESQPLKYIGKPPALHTNFKQIKIFFFYQKF